MAESSYQTSSQSGLISDYNPKVQWAIPNTIDHMTFIGKEVLAVAHDLYIIFLNLEKNSEMVYVANNKEKGDGVDVIAGHQSMLFAFAEKVKNGRIFMMTYPHFKKLAELTDIDVNRYKGLCIMECDLVAAVSGFPNYLISVWSWRTNQRLLSIPTGVIRRRQIFMASHTHMLLAQCWGEGLIVWEVAQCFRKCLMMKRVKEEVVGWEQSDPLLVSICWSNEGNLYAVDAKANLYNLQSDGIGMKLHKEWGDESHRGTHKPHLCAFGNGLLIYGPDKYLRALKKTEHKWNVVFTFTPNDEIQRLVSNATCDMAAIWTKAGLVYRVTGESEAKVVVTPMIYKQRNIKKIHMLASDNKYLVTISETCVLCIYELETGRLVVVTAVEGEDVSFEVSPVEPIIVVYGCVDEKYGMSMYLLTAELQLERVARAALTHQAVTRVVFSDTGRELMAAAMAAGNVFIYKFNKDHTLTLVRYSELGRGLADCLLMRVGDSVRSFSLVLFSDKYLIGERIICIDAETGKDNKFTGKLMGPYAHLLQLKVPDTMLAIPHLSQQLHILKLQADKGITVSVKMGPIFDSGHDIKHISGFYNGSALLTCDFGGSLVMRRPEGPKEYEVKVSVSHRYEHGVKRVLIDKELSTVAHLGGNRTCAVLCLQARAGPPEQPGPARGTFDLSLLDEGNFVTVIERTDKTYLDLQEDKKVREEAMDYRKQKEEVVNSFKVLQTKVVELLEENIAEKPLHQLSLSEFNLHLELRKERKIQAEREREEIRLQTEALICAQDKVTLWIKNFCWDSMLTPRVKLFAIFSHYQVENYPVLPSQRDKWPELNRTEALRLLEMENDHNLFRPWLESPVELTSTEHLQILALGAESRARQAEGRAPEPAEEEAHQPHVLAGSAAHLYVPPPPYTLPQTHAYSYLHMNQAQETVKLTVQKVRMWFNKQFDDLMNLKKREVGLVEERNARLRFIIEELNKLSDLRGSFHHLVIEIKDPEWRQEEQPHRLIKVDPEECSIEPYISPSQIVIVPPDPGPKDDFKERALMEMMDGVLEKLWHEEIKKAIPMPQCMLEKDPDHFNEDDLRLVFDYEAKVAFRNEERDKYRKMLHAEYAKLSQILNEGIVKFNHKLKEVWLLKLKMDSVIGQENLNLMRLRRTNLDRLEMDEKLNVMRADIVHHEDEVEVLSRELQVIQDQSAECQAAYDALTIKDRHLERTYRNHFADLSPIIVDQCYKFFKKRPKWHQRVSMIPVVLYELAGAVASGVRPPLLHADCVDYFKGVDHLDLVTNMPPVMDEGLWATMCKLRRAKIENEIRIRAAAQEMTYVESALGVWHRAVLARRHRLAAADSDVLKHRDLAERTSRNKNIQLVLPAGQVEIITTGHIEDYEDATLILKTDVEAINNLILRVGQMKLRMMRKQMEFRKKILAKEWEHAQMKMKLRHMQQELYSYQRLKINKELQHYLKNKELGYTEEQEFVRMEKEMEASKFAVNKGLEEQIHRVEDLEVRINSLESKKDSLEKLIESLNVKISEKRLKDDPLDPIRIRRLFKTRMETLVMRSKLIREVQANHTTIVMLQTELELLRLKTYPTLASFRTYN